MNPNSNTSAAKLLEQLSNANGTQFEEAKPAPAATKHSLNFYQREIENIFAQEWVCVGREDEIAQQGSYLSYNIASVPVFVIRQNSGAVAAFVNTCAHRQACLLEGKSGKVKKITCRYHAWSYDLEGQLLAAPYMDMEPDFNKSDHQLRPLHVEIWEGFIYVSLSAHPATKLQEVLQPFSKNVIGRFDMACYKTVLRRTMNWDANWKNLIENFTESYHVPIAHRETFAKHGKPLEEYICGEDSDYYGYHRAAQKSEMGMGAAHVKNHRLKGEWRRMMVDFCIFPCHLVTLMPDYLWWVSVQPESVDRLNATWGVAVPPEVLEDISDSDYKSWLTNFEEYIDIANAEDKVLVEALQKGTSSPILPTGAFHPIERNLWQFNRYLLRMCRE